MVVAVVSAVFVVTLLLRRQRDAARWSAVARGGIWLIVAMVVIGFFAFFAFDTVFLLFHGHPRDVRRVRGGRASDPVDQAVVRAGNARFSLSYRAGCSDRRLGDPL